MSASLVQGRYVIRGVTPEGRAEVLEDGAVLQQNGIVVEVGPSAALKAAHPGVPVLGSPGSLVCPGFVNSHHHVGLTPLQLGAPDLPLELWLIRRLACRGVDLYLDTLYSAFEMLSSGITTVQHLHGRGAGSVDAAVAASEDVIRAYRDVGMRVSYSYGLRDQNRLTHEDDAAFLRRLPDGLAAEAAEVLRETSLDAAGALDVFRALHAEHAGEGKVRIQLAPVNLHWCSDGTIVRAVETARDFGVPLHMHLLETVYQREYARRRTGGSAVAHLRGLGVLGPDLTLGHGVWATGDDIAMLAESGTCLCHNCSSNLRLRSGVAPLNAYRRRGVCIGLGIDEAGLNDDRDMLQEMRLVLNLHREPGMDPASVPSATEVFRMATSDGAATTPYGDAIGRLDPMRAADLLLFDWDAIAFPYLSDDIPVLDALVQRGRTRHLRAVMVAGELILRDGEFTRIDRAAALEELAARMRVPLTERERRNRRVGLGAADHARAVYADYEGAIGGEPFYGSRARD
jgi:cytosine/adenosine deaminase-related metal-dependent hydrolase